MQPEPQCCFTPKETQPQGFFSSAPELNFTNRRILDANTVRASRDLLGPTRILDLLGPKEWSRRNRRKPWPRGRGIFEVQGVDVHADPEAHRRDGQALHPLQTPGIPRKRRLSVWGSSKTFSRLKPNCRKPWQWFDLGKNASLKEERYLEVSPRLWVHTHFSEKNNGLTLLAALGSAPT